MIAPPHSNSKLVSVGARRRIASGALLALGLAAVVALACEPDLDALSAEYGHAGSDGSAGASGANGSAGAAPGGAAGSDGTSGAAGGTFIEPSCDNAIEDVNETDVDCGGSSECSRCTTGRKCDSNPDCASDYCTGGRCREPSCSDEVKNQDETGVDCGGSCAPALRCADGVGCIGDSDCESGFCLDEVCTDHCLSEVLEADETDIDCGGADCAPCGDDLRCVRASDCESRVCSNNSCVKASCSDGIQNQDEGDKDCGGACVPEKFCQLGDSCNAMSDCASGVCDNGTCVADIEVPAEAIIDNFEDGDLIVAAQGGRGGTWYFFDDGVGSMEWSVEPLPMPRGEDSEFAIHHQGSGFSSWGAGVGLNYTQPMEVHDVSGYSGITFWGRAASSLALHVVFPDINTTGIYDARTCEVCDHHWYTSVTLSAEWRRFTVNFDELTLEPGGDPIPTAPDLAAQLQLQFRTNPGVTFDYWVDDLAFVP